MFGHLTSSFFLTKKPQNIAFNIPEGERKTSKKFFFWGGGVKNQKKKIEFEERNIKMCLNY